MHFICSGVFKLYLFFYYFLLPKTNILLNFKDIKDFTGFTHMLSYSLKYIIIQYNQFFFRPNNKNKNKIIQKKKCSAINFENDTKIDRWVLDKQAGRRVGGGRAWMGRNHYTTYNYSTESSEWKYLSSLSCFKVLE